MTPRWSRHMWWVLAFASLVTLALWLRPSAGFQPQWATIFLGGALIAFLVNFLIPVGEAQVSLAHAISLTVGVALGPGAAGLGLVIGLTLGKMIGAIWRQRNAEKPFNLMREVQAWALILSRQLLSLSGALAIYLLLGGHPLVETHGLFQVVPTLGLAVSFSIFFLALHWLNRLTLFSRRTPRREIITLVAVTMAPIPFAMLGAASYALLEIIGLLIFGAIACTVAPILHNLVITERDLNRRLQELSTISRISQAMRTSLDLDTLLTTIYLQVAHLLKVDSFYIALYHPDQELISYPIAIKNGIRKTWCNRKMTDRLTDRVIQTGRPILIPHDASNVLQEMGLPELDNAPEAWLGVPLLNPERAFGCLAVFHMNSGMPFTHKDLDVLATLAGQAAAAIENALLYQQTRSRAQVLASLNEISTSISSTLDPERALELVSQAMIRVGGGEKSAIFLVDPDRAHLFLAKGINLSETFIEDWLIIPIDDQERSQAFHSQEPVLISNVTDAQLPEEIVVQLVSEGVHACADFPLITPSGTIGHICVYFTEPQRFEADHIELLKTFAAQAALAVANARAHAATDQALQRRVEHLAALDAIGREMTSTLNMEDLFEAILIHALHVTDSSMGHLAIHDPETRGLRIVAHQGYSPNSQIVDPSYSHPADRGLLGRVLKTTELCNIPDALSDADQIIWNDGASRSTLCVPILRQGRVMGIIIVESADQAAFTDEHEQFLTQLASQAAIALANATLYQQLEARLREQSLLYQASTQIAATLESEAVALAIADSLAVALSMDGAAVSRWDAASSTLTLQAAIKNGKPANEFGQKRFSEADAPALSRCLKEVRPIQWTVADAPTPADRRHLTEFQGSGSVLAVPLVLGEQTLGLIEVFSAKERHFDENAVRTALTIASQAAIALENTDLFQRINESHNLLKAVLNSTHEGMLMVDTQGKIVVANHQFEMLTGITVEKLVNSYLSDQELEIAERLGYRPSELANLIAALSGGQAIAGEVYNFDTQPPNLRTLQRSDAPVHDAHGELIGWLVVLRDVTEERELSAAREQLTEMIVHDLRSPLTAILGSLKLLEVSLDGGEHSTQAAQALSVSHRSVQQMLGLVNSLLDIAKLESDELEINLKRISIQALCEELVATYVHEANEGGIILNLDITEEIPDIDGDEAMLRRVLTNLLDNALKFTPSGGRVDLLLERHQNLVTIIVSDTGPGIPEEFHERIFERFGQVPGQSGRRRGTGLGLAFARLSVNAHGGKIWVENNPSSGSSFHIQLPLPGAVAEPPPSQP